MNLSDIPRPLLVGVIIVLGVFSFFLIQKPHTACDSQLELLKGNQAGYIFYAKGKASMRPPLVRKQQEMCLQGNSSGSCYEYYLTIRRLLDDLAILPSNCKQELEDLGEVLPRLRQAASLMVQQAWGEDPPGPGQFGWFQASDLNLFCRIRDQLVKFSGPDSWEEFRISMYSQLPGEPRRFSKEGKCENCENGQRKMADQIFGANDLWARSLFAVNCDRYR